MKRKREREVGWGEEGTFNHSNREEAISGNQRAEWNNNTLADSIQSNWMTN